MEPILVVIWKALLARGWTRQEFDVWVLPSIGKPMSTEEAIRVQTLREIASAP